MVHSLKEAETRETLRRCHANQQREALLPAAWTKPPANSYNVFLLFNLAGWAYWTASAANYVVGGVLSYFLNKHFTFQNKERGWAQVGRFALTVAVCWLIAYGVAKPLALWALSGQSGKIQENVALLVGMVLYTGLNYFGQRFFAFRKKNS